MTPVGVGMSVITDEVKAAATADATKAATTAVTQSKSVWDTISDVVKSVAPTAQAAVLAKYAPTVANATNNVAGQQVVSSGSYISKPIWSQGWFWGAVGVIAVATVGVVAMKPAKRRGR